MNPRRRSVSRLARAGALAAAGCLIMVSCSQPGGKITMSKPAAADSPSTQPSTTGDPSSPALVGAVEWGSCAEVDIAVSTTVRNSARSDGMECGTVDVPTDHDDPTGPTISLALAMLPSSGNADERIGSLIVNPGGPGGSGLEFLASSGVAIPEDVRNSFDIVSFDPRGIGASAPLDCLTEEQRQKLVESETSEDPAAAQAQATEAESSMVAGCTADDEVLFNNMGTDEVVDDLDMIRQAVGDQQLTFLGLSYGTRIAAGYATKYPDNVRAMVLDGSVTPSRDLVQSSGGQIKGIVRTLTAVTDLCAADPACPLRSDPMGAINAVADGLDATPLEVDTSNGPELLTKDKFATGIVTTLYDPATADALISAVDSLQSGSAQDRQLAGSFLLELAGRQSSKRPDGTYGNGFETQSIVNCLDADGALTVDELPAVRALAGPLPAFLDSDPAADAGSCLLLPTGDDLEIAPTSAVDRLLVVGTRGDPATPIEWTTEMVAALGDPATIIYGGSGHTASLSRQCVIDQTASFLIDGQLDNPKDCPKDPDEADIYAQLARQFEMVGLGAETGKCIADELRTQTNQLEVLSLNTEDPDPQLVQLLQQVAMGCR